MLKSWRSLRSPKLPGPSFPAYESPPTANRGDPLVGFYHSAGRHPANFTPPSAGGGGGTFSGKRNQIPISTSEVQVTVAPIPLCRSKTSGENLTEVRSVRTNRLNVLSQPISDSVWMDIILSSSCCCSQTPVM